MRARLQNHHNRLPHPTAAAVCSPPRPGIKFLSPGRSNFAAHLKCAKSLTHSLGPFAAFLRHSRRRSSFSPPEIDSVASPSSSQFSISNHGWMKQPRVVSLVRRLLSPPSIFARRVTPFNRCRGTLGRWELHFAAAASLLYYEFKSCDFNQQSNAFVTHADCSFRYVIIDNGDNNCAGLTRKALACFCETKY